MASVWIKRSLQSAGKRVNTQSRLLQTAQPSTQKTQIAGISSLDQKQWGDRSHSSHHHPSGGSWGSLAAAVGLAGMAWIAQQNYPRGLNAVQCEQTQKKTSSSAQTSQESGEEQQQEPVNAYVIGPDDPLYDIPDTDEETDCQLCITFRQGPCRVHWRRFELCVKANDPKQKQQQPTQEDNGEENNSKDEVLSKATADTTTSESDTQASNQSAVSRKTEEDDNTSENNNNTSKGDPEKCFRYAMPFYQCSMKHMNAYALIGNEVTLNRVIQPLHDVYTATGEQQMCWAENPVMVWDKWEAFVSKLYELGGKLPTKYHSDKTGFTSVSQAVLATLKSNNKKKQYVMMDDQEEPILVPIYAMVPKQLNDLKLFMTYALDQHGNLLGDKRCDEEEEQKKVNSQQSEEEGGDQQEEEPSPDLPLMIQLVPGHTDQVTVYAVYLPQGEEDVLKGKLFESRPYSVKKVTKQATKQAKDNMQQK